MKKTIFIIAALAFLGSCREDTIELETYGRLAGEVLDSDSLLPIAGVNITTNPETDLVTTDEFGEFTIDSLLEGSYSIRARLAGYEDAVISVQLDGNEVNSVTLLMSIDETLNEPPSLPSIVQPANGAQGLDPDLTLAWTASDSDGDSLLYDVYLFTSDTSNAIPLALETPDTFLYINNMRFNQRYYWQVVARDGVNPPTYGEVWSFTLREYPRDDYRYVFVRPKNGNFVIYGGQEPDLGSTLGEEASFQLTNGMESYWRPKLRPLLRDKMAALHLVGTETHIFVMDRDGSMPRQVTSNVPLRSKDETLASYCWSPTGDQLMYMNFGRLYRINRDGSGLRLAAQADDGFLFTGVDWTPLDNGVIVATAERPDSRQSKLYLFELDSIPRPRLEGVLNGQIRHPVFSPSGTTIAFSYNDNNDFSASGMPLNSQILIYNTENGALMNLSFGKEDGTNDTQPRFINGGAKVLFVNRPNDNIGPSKVMFMDVETTQNQNRTLIFENADMPDWN